MRTEDLLLLACARQNFLPTHREEVLRLAMVKRLAWEEIYRTAKRHKVAPLVYVNLLKCGDSLLLPAGVAKKFEVERDGNVRWKRAAADRLAAALACFNAHCVDAMVLKGAALDLVVYDEPWYTVADDVDLVLRCRRDGPEFEWVREQAKQLRDSSIEFDFYEHHDVTMNGVLRIDFERIWRNAVPVDFQGCRALLMPVEDLLLSVCINSCRKRYFRLRSLCDIAECIARHRELDWDIFVRRVRECDSGSIVYTALLVTKWTIGCDIPPGLLDSLGVNPVRLRLLRSLVYLLLRVGSLFSFVCHSGDRRIDPSLCLSYASYRWSQAGLSLWRAPGWMLRRRKYRRAAS